MEPVEGIASTGRVASDRPSAIISLAIPPTPSATKKTSRKCSSCAKAKKAIYTCKVDPGDPDGPCVECKTRRRADTCDRRPGTPSRRHIGAHYPHPGLADDLDHERLRNDVDNMKRSQEEVKTTLNAIQQTLAMLTTRTAQSHFVGNIHAPRDRSQMVNSFGPALNWAPEARFSTPTDYSNHETYPVDFTIAQNALVPGPNFASPWISSVQDFSLDSGTAQVASVPNADIYWQPPRYCIREYLSALDLEARIINFLDTHLTSRQVKITGIRTSALQDLQTGKGIRIVQWQEGTDIEAMALFEADDAQFCNVLIHHGEGTTFQNDGSRWRNPRICWSVRDFDILKQLHKALIQALGRRNVPADDLERRLANANATPESLSYENAAHLLEYLTDMQILEARFDDDRTTFQKVSSFDDQSGMWKGEMDFSERQYVQMNR